MPLTAINNYKEDQLYLPFSILKPALFNIAEVIKFYIILNFTGVSKNMNIENYIELTALKPDTRLNDIEAVCNEAVENKISTICVPPLFVKKAKALTDETSVNICASVGFPFGYSPIEAKLAEIVLAIIDAGDEIEMVVNTSAIKNKDWQYVGHEINTLLPVIRGKGKKITVVLESGLLSDEEIIIACDIYGVAGVEFMKVGTGFIENSQVFEHLQLIRKHLAMAVQLKVPAAKVHYGMAQNLIKAGADRLCCPSSLVLIQESLQQN